MMTPSRLFFAATTLTLGALGANGLCAGELPTGLWTNVTAETIGETAEWSNKVELADLNEDGWVDILFANGGNYNEPGEPELSRIFFNQGPGKPFKEVTKEVFGTEGMHVRSIKTADVNADGHIDIFFAATYQTRSKLLLGKGKGKFVDATKLIPDAPHSFGDAEFGDADLDGDLDLILADWGPGDPMENEGAQVRLWLNDGKGRFTDATEAMLPPAKVRMSWDIEFADVDNDLDLDIMVSSKRSEGSFLFINDGKGMFTDVTAERMPQLTNNYEFEPLDLSGDGYVDTFTINDGGIIEGTKNSRRESVFLGDGKGGFLLATETSLPASENLGFDDNRVAYLDFDSDGDADVIIGSLSGPDRLLINDGMGHFKVATEVFDGPETRGTLGLALADLDGDLRQDVVMVQGEVKGFVSEQVYFGKGLAPDTAAPKITLVKAVGGFVRARITDNKSPEKPFDFKNIWIESTSPTAAMDPIPLAWYGEHLWQAKVPVNDLKMARLCASDAAGNQTCRILQ